MKAWNYETSFFIQIGKRDELLGKVMMGILNLEPVTLGNASYIQTRLRFHVNDAIQVEDALKKPWHANKISYIVRRSLFITPTIVFAFKVHFFPS